MAIDPEVIPSSSSAGSNAIRQFPKWVIYAGITLIVLLVVGIMKMLLPLILMGLVLRLIWNQANKT